MTVAGIIAEYNPFHKGHAWQIQAIRQRLGENTAIVCAMSGNYVQRGDCAMFPKHCRAELALRGGADLVLELPLTWSTASAERFAQGGVEVLAATGVVDTLVFGSESGDLTPLQKIADAVDSPDFPTELQRWLRTGLSFAVARQRAVEGILTVPCDLSQPNNLLGVEYLRATRGTGLTPLTIQRTGAGHHQVGSGEITSASDIRRRLLAGESVQQFLPDTRRNMADIPRAALSFNQRGVLTQLRTMTPEAFLQLPDCGDGLEHRMAHAAQQGRTLEEIYALAKTKRFAHARIRRLVLWSYLGLTQADFLPHVPYLRVLGMNQRGMELLHQMRKRAAYPILTKPAAVRKLNEACQHQFSVESRGTDLYLLCQQTLSSNAGGAEWRHGPIVLQD